MDDRIRIRPTGPRPEGFTEADIFCEAVLRADGCMEWLGYNTPDGYARTQIKGKLRLVHHFFFELLRGPIPKGHMLHHLCENKWCVNPFHLKPLTPKEHVWFHHGINLPPGVERCKGYRVFDGHKRKCELEQGHSGECLRTTPERAFRWTFKPGRPRPRLA